MKRLLLILACVLLALTPMVALAYSPDPHIPGDANSDGIVDALDLSILQAAYLSYPAERLINPAYNARWDARADFNNELIVNAQDFSILAMNYGTFNP